MKKTAEGLKTVVKSSVETNLKEQMKSYSEVVAENVMVCSGDSLVDPSTLKKVAKSVVEEENRSRKVVIFEESGGNVAQIRRRRYLERLDSSRFYWLAMSSRGVTPR